MWYLLLKDCNMEVGTDVSDLGWGLYFQGQMRQGLWLDIADAPDHIDVKELMVLHIFLWEFLPFPAIQSLFWRTNCTATCPKYGKKVAQYLNLSFVCNNSIGTS